eukprot:TRINITY_DN20091_c1_g1_i1.p1 TRINITY_DN20091_c1_g1~~TRINITY_DN20091_c1_g1_i1.p1  ORF type:complete len:623 (+),score=93.41 TRINITY_DN20091_c1_g1_i1:84-1952(+)
MVYQVVRPTLGEMLKVFKCKACIVSTPEKMPAPGSNDPPYDVVPTMKILEHLCDTAKCLLPAYDFAGSASKKDCSDKLPDCNMSAGDWTCPASIAQSQWARYWMGRVRATLTTLAFTTQPAEVKVTAFAGYDSSNAYSVQAGNIIIFAISLGPGGPITQTEFSLLPSLFSGTIADISTRNVRLNPVQIWWLHFEHVRDMVRAFQGYGYLDVHRYVQFDRPRGKPLRWNDTDANQPSHDFLTPRRQRPDGYWSYLMSGYEPGLALGLAQALHSYFWWGADGGAAAAAGAGPSVPVAATALELFERSLRHASCDLARTSRRDFLLRKCPYRWRFTLLLGSELGLSLALGPAQDFAAAASALRRTAEHAADAASLPYFREPGAPEKALPLRFNQNWDYFPRAAHWPVWPREAWPPLASFLERGFETFRAALEELLAGGEGDPFAPAARFQNGLTPRDADWARLKLIHSGGPSELCEASPHLAAACRLLATRPEIGPRCGTYLSGASLARLRPGAELKLHFGTHPRLTVHLGLRTPPGASLTVGGEEVIWREGRAVVFDDTYAHKVQHRGDEDRYVLVAWFCHPCDLGWRRGLGPEWQEQNPLPELCGGGGGGYLEPPVPGYGEVP